MSAVRARFEVVPVKNHVITEMVAQFEDTGEKRPNGKSIMQYVGCKQQTRTVKNGFMVYFPRKHSIFVESEEALKRLKLDEENVLVDMSTGERVDPNAQPQSLKDAHDRALSNNERPASRGGVEGMIAALE